MKIYGPLIAATAEILSTDPTAQIQGRLWYNTTTPSLKYSNGTASFNILTDFLGTTKGDILARTSTGFARVAVGTDGQVLTSASAQTPGVQWTTQAFASAPNKLLNGGFDLWQRNTTGIAANAATLYVADRWYIKNSLGTNGALQCAQSAGSVAGSKFGAQVSITTAPTALQTNGSELYQVVDNLSSLALLGQAASFSVQIKALGNVTAVGLQFCYAASEIKPTLFIGSEQSVTVTTGAFALGSLLNQTLTAATITNAGVVGVRIRILTVSTGNTYDLNNGFIVEQAMLNVGSTASGFSRAAPTAAGEFAMCQRYYEKSYPLATFPAASVGTDSAGAYVLRVSQPSGTGPVRANQRFATAKRVAPTPVLYSTTGTVATIRDRTNSTDAGAVPVSASIGSFAIEASLTSASTSVFFEGHWAADAEI